MKKLFFTLGLACIFMVACNNTPKQEEKQPEQPTETTEQVVEEKHECPMASLKEQFANWENLNDEAKTALIADATKLFADMDAKMAEMKEEGKEACEKMAEMTEEQKAACEAKCAEMKAAWDNFANLNLDEQKDLIMKRLEGCGGEKACCKGEKAEGSCCEQKPADAE